MCPLFCHVHVFFVFLLDRPVVPDELAEAANGTGGGEASAGAGAGAGDGAGLAGDGEEAAAAGGAGKKKKKKKKDKKVEEGGDASAKVNLQVDTVLVFLLRFCGVKRFSTVARFQSSLCFCGVSIKN